MILRGSLDIEEYGVSRQMLLPLDEYMARGYLPHFAALLEDSGLESQLKASDGHIYQIGFLISQGVNTNGHFFLNQTWLDRLGLPVPRTLEELTETLRRFRDGDPNGNGWQDVPWNSPLTTTSPGSITCFPSSGCRSTRTMSTWMRRAGWPSRRRIPPSSARRSGCIRCTWRGCWTWISSARAAISGRPR